MTTTQKLASDTQIEKMEKELAKMRAGLTESIQLMEQREMNTNIEYAKSFIALENTKLIFLGMSSLHYALMLCEKSYTLRLRRCSTTLSNLRSTFRRIWRITKVL